MENLLEKYVNAFIKGEPQSERFLRAKSSLTTVRPHFKQIVKSLNKDTSLVNRYWFTGIHKYGNNSEEGSFDHFGYKFSFYKGLFHVADVVSYAGLSHEHIFSPDLNVDKNHTEPLLKELNASKPYTVDNKLSLKARHF